MKKFIWIFILTMISLVSFCQTEKNPVAVFILNGDSAKLPALFEDDDPLNGDYYISAAKLNITIAAKVAPEISLSLKIFITEFNGKDMQGHANGMLLRRNSPMENLYTYSSNYMAGGNQGFIKLNITNFTLKSLPSKNQYGEAFVSGTFEADLLCTSCCSVPGEIQHITSGKFENIPIAVWK
jgi:hypothetical protein